MAKVAVVGAGIAGLSCARALIDAGHQVRIFEKSRGPGGRMATRRTAYGSYDHGAQYFTARNPAFQSPVKTWVAAGLVAPYDGRIAQIKAGEMQLLAPAEPRFVATPSMNALCRSLGIDISIELECTVIAITPGENGWRLSWDEGGESGFDAVGLAIPAVQAVPLCAAAPDLAARAGTAEYAPCWTAMVCFAEPPGVAFDAAFVQDPVLGWVMRDASRPERAAGERWVLQANAAWSTQHLEEPATDIAPQLVAAFQALTDHSPAPVEMVAHRWRYALTAGTGTGCLWDAGLRIGACGDWCTDGRIEGAWLSGAKLAAAMQLVF